MARVVPVPDQVIPLNDDEYEFVDKYMTLKFLKGYGTQPGYTNFCRKAKAAGQWTCAGDSSKAAYATYLKNAVVTRGGRKEKLFKIAMDDFVGSLDVWTQDAMASRIARGKKLQPPARRANVSMDCALRMSKEEIKRVADTYGVSIAGLTPIQACAKLTNDPKSAEFFAGKNVRVLDRTPALPMTKYGKYVRKGAGVRAKPEKVPRTYGQVVAEEAMAVPADAPIDVAAYLPTAPAAKKVDWRHF